MIGQREVRFNVSSLTERDSLRVGVGGTTNKKAAKVTRGRSTEWGRRRGVADRQKGQGRNRQADRQKGQSRNRRADRKAKIESDMQTERPRQKQTGGQKGQGRNRQT